MYERKKNHKRFLHDSVSSVLFERGMAGVFDISNFFPATLDFDLPHSHRTNFLNSAHLLRYYTLILYHFPARLYKSI